MRARSVFNGLVGIIAGAGLVLGACGGDGDDQVPDGNQDPTQSASDSGSVSNSSVAPNTFLTFEGERYRLVDLEQANLAPSDEEYRSVGTATEADIDQSDLTVYRRDGDTEAIYTYAVAEGEAEETTPALWYRWVPDA